MITENFVEKKSEISLQLDKFGVFQFTYHLDSNFSCYYEPVFLLYTPVSLQLNYLLYSSDHCGHLLISHQHPGAGRQLSLLRLLISQKLTPLGAVPDTLLGSWGAFDPVDCPNFLILRLL